MRFIRAVFWLALSLTYTSALAEVVYSEVSIDYNNEWLFLNNTDLPGFPSKKTSQYVKEFVWYGDRYDVPLTEAKATEMIFKSAKGSFDESLTYTYINSAGNEIRDTFHDINQPVWHIMRDILFLETMQHSIQLWNERYVEPIKPKEIIDFEGAYEVANEIAKLFAQYQNEERDGKNPLISAIFAAGNNRYGSVILGGLYQSLKKNVMNFLFEMIVNQKNIFLSETGKLVLKPGKLAITSFAVRALKNYFVQSPGANDTAEEIFVLLDIGLTGVSALKGGLGLIMAPGKMMYDALSYLAEVAEEKSRGAQLLNYYHLAKNYPKALDCKAIFSEFGGLQLNGSLGGTAEYSILMNTPGCNATITNSDTIYKGLILRNYLFYNAESWNADAISAVQAIADLFVVIEGLDIDQMKQNLFGFAYLQYLADKGLNLDFDYWMDNEGAAPTTVKFDSSITQWPVNALVEYHWYFGDGGESFEANPEHIYTRPGNYNASLSVIVNGDQYPPLEKEIVVKKEREKPTITVVDFSKTDASFFVKLRHHSPESYDLPTSEWVEWDVYTDQIFSSELIDLSVKLTIGEQDRGQKGSVYVAASLGNSPVLYMKNSDEQWVEWNGQIDGLIPYYTGKLGDAKSITIAEGLTGMAGHFKVYIGYLNTNSEFIFNGMNIIEFDVVDAPISNRYTDNGDGTVIDNRSGLIWLKNANCFGQQDWETAMQSAANLVSGQCGLSDGSTAGMWRLPSKEEWQAMIDQNYNWPNGPTLSNAAGTDKWTEGDAFSSVQDFYWSSSMFPYNAPWIVSLRFIWARPLADTIYVWPAR